MTAETVSMNDLMQLAWFEPGRWVSEWVHNRRVSVQYTGWHDDGTPPYAFDVNGRPVDVEQAARCLEGE